MRAVTNETAVREAIESTGYESDDIQVRYVMDEDQVIVHPLNRLTTALSNVSQVLSTPAAQC